MLIDENDKLEYKEKVSNSLPKISVLVLFYRAVSLILGINCLILGEVALFSLPVLKEGNLSKHEHTLIPVNRPIGKDV